MMKKRDKSESIFSLVENMDKEGQYEENMTIIFIEHVNIRSYLISNSR
jgi:hypothetical protein